MAKRNNIEHQIRDYLAENLTVIEPDLKLIDIEYYLKNNDKNASSGFIDILAIDSFNQFVVIEIKRSKAASRSAMNEILKYLNLLKENYRINDSDVRFIIISTEWNELINSYSELFYKTDISLSGYKITWSNQQIIKKELIQPTQPKNKRVFSPAQKAYLYKDNKIKFQQGIKQLKSSLKRIGINDYIILQMNKNNIPYPYALYLAFLRLSEDEYEKMLSEEDRIEIEEYKEYIIENEQPKDEYLKYIEDHIYLKLHIYSDSAEAGYPEKLDSIIHQNWKIFDVEKGGVFKNDPRFNLNDIVLEISGKRGQNIGQYMNSCETSHRSRMKEIKDNSRFCLHNNSEWLKTTTKILKYLSNKKGIQSMKISIYNPPSILYGLYKYATLKSEDYLPLYYIFIEDLEKQTLEIFKGVMSWSGELREPHKLLARLCDNKCYDLMLALTLNNHLRGDIINAFGFKFETFYKKNDIRNLNNDKKRNNHFYPIDINKHNNIIRVDSDNYELSHFFNTNKSLINELVKMIKVNSMWI